MRSVVYLLRIWLFLSLALGMGPFPSVRGDSASAKSKKRKRQAHRPAGKRRRGRRKKLRRLRQSFTYKVKIRRGDTLARIAKRYRVSIRDLRRWNRLRGNRLRLGQMLIVRSRQPLRIQRRRFYVVRRGDTLARIARKLQVSVRALRRWNRKTRRLRVGRRLSYYSSKPQLLALSLGKPNRGRLRHGEQLPPGIGYVVRNPKRSYGTNNTISHVMHCLRMLKRRYRRAPKLVIGNLSRDGGGRMRPHRSHQSGRDVDIAYYYKSPNGSCKLKVVTPSTLDAQKTWYLMRCFLNTRDVDMILVDYSLQRPLYRVARRYLRRGVLNRVFQYPRGRGAKAVIRHIKGHKHHFHVRFKCPRRSPHCD